MKYALTILLITLLACGGTSTRPAPLEVTYKIETSDRAKISLTYTTGDGATIQEKTGSPWSKSFTVPACQPVTLLAQRDSQGAGKISCTILAGDKVIQTAESSGEYVIASCTTVIK